MGVTVVKRHMKNRSSTPADLDPDEYVEFIIDSAAKGNWTRYINHYCDPNTEFWMPNIGMRTTQLIHAIKDIQFWEEITVSYGETFYPIEDCRAVVLRTNVYVGKKVTKDRRAS